MVLHVSNYHCTVLSPWKVHTQPHTYSICGQVPEQNKVPGETVIGTIVKITEKKYFQNVHFEIIQPCLLFMYNNNK